MAFFVRLFKAVQESRQLEADRVIRRNWHLVEQARAHQGSRASEAAKFNAAPALTPASMVRIINVQPFSMTAFVRPKPQRAIARSRHYDEQDYDNYGVLVVASAWLLFYCLSLSTFVFKQGADVLASFLQSLS